MKGASRISITFVSPEFITVPGIDEVLNMYLLNEQMNKKYNYQRLQTVWESELRETRFSKIDLVMAVQFHDTLKIIELYTLNEWIVWYVNCSSLGLRMTKDCKTTFQEEKLKTLGVNRRFCSQGRVERGRTLWESELPADWTSCPQYLRTSLHGNCSSMRGTEAPGNRVMYQRDG